MIRRRGPGAASSSAVAAEAAGSLSSAETPARAPEKQNHSAGLERGAAGRRGRLGRRDRRREGAGEGDQATAGREPRRRAATSVPRLQAGRGGAGGARSPRRAAWGAARWRCAQVPAAEAARRGARRCGTAAAREGISAAATVKTRPQRVLRCSPAVPASCTPFTPASPLPFRPHSGSPLSNPHPFMA